MKSLALSETGDLIIEHNELSMVYGADLVRQKIREVINTNKGEWFFDWEQGINFSEILGKGVTDEDVRLQIDNGLKQVQEGLIMSDFSIERKGRTLIANFTAINENTGTELELTAEY